MCPLLYSIILLADGRVCCEKFLLIVLEHLEHNILQNETTKKVKIFTIIIAVATIYN